MSVVFVYMTTRDTEEARRIGSDLVRGRMAACVNVIDPMHSLFWWDGKVQEERETVLIAKTSEDRVTELTERVKSIHSYDCPCIVVIPVTYGNDAFLKWIHEQTRAESAPGPQNKIQEL